MIRRGFWLAAGAVLGVTGYRRVTRLARVLTVPRTPGLRSLPGPGPTAGPPMLAPPRRATSQVSRAVSAARFVRDVREGMAEYRDLHRSPPASACQGRTLEGQSYRGESYRGAGYQGAGYEGEGHRRAGDRTSSGDSRQGLREP
jgi:hypothetical protein